MFCLLGISLTPSSKSEFNSRSHKCIKSSWTFWAVFVVMKSMRPPLRKLIVIRKCKKSREHMYKYTKLAKNWWITLMLTCSRVAHGDKCCLMSTEMSTSMKYNNFDQWIMINNNLSKKSASNFFVFFKEIHSIENPIWIFGFLSSAHLKLERSVFFEMLTFENQHVS